MSPILTDSELGEAIEVQSLALRSNIRSRIAVTNHFIEEEV
jgi:hypothetical protein